MSVPMMSRWSRPGVAGGAERDAGTTPGRQWGVAGVVLVVAVGMVVRTYSPSALWLDEAISVSISALPLGEVHEGLRRDGAPPLYALLLWGWLRLVGDSPHEVRALSAVFGIAALPLAALAGGRLAGGAGAVAALLLLATSPFAVYYSTEARMYSLVVLLVLSGFLVLDDYRRDPSIRRGALVALVTAALALTHYWTLFLLAVVAGALVARAVRARQTREVRAAAWMAAGGLLFLPWVPTFLFQAGHTGTPWGRPAAFSAVASSLENWSGGLTSAGRLLAVLLLLLAGLGATAVAASGTRVVVDLRGDPPGRGLAVVAVGTLLLALAVARVTGAAFAPRYTSVAFPLFLLLAAVGLSWLPPRVRTPVLVVAVLAGLAGAVPSVVNVGKTQAPVLSQALRDQALPGDLVVYCPDQLGPATSRLLPHDLQQEVYPTAGRPERVDWVDYTERNRRADPDAYVRELSRRAKGRAVWLVSRDGYRTYEGQCQGLARALTALRGQPLTLVEADRLYSERAELRGWAPRPRTGS